MKTILLEVLLVVLVLGACDDGGSSSQGTDLSDSSPDLGTDGDQSSLEDTGTDASGVVPQDTSEQDVPMDAQSMQVDVLGDTAGTVDLTDPLGGERPATVYLPDDYDAATAWPIVFLLHGYGASGTVQDIYFGFRRQRTELGFIAVVPDGTTDASDKQFWNATPACCDFAPTGVDDVAYLWGLVEEARQRYTIDPDRIHFMGHSNGGFMSYRMACEHGDEIAAIVSLAGSTFLDGADCANPGQVSVLQIHGDMDETIPYNGSGGYPSAPDTVARWAERIGCDDLPVDGTPINVDRGLAGDETLARHWTNCAPGTGASLWTIEGGGHIPQLTPDFITGSLDFLLSHPRTGN